MKYLVVMVVALAGVALAMPQRKAPAPLARAPTDDAYTRILSFESYQDGGNFGHEFLQEDGTGQGQKLGPDGLLYGFYSYIQDDGNRVKVFWRSGQGVGYEVIGVEGLDQNNLGNLRATVNLEPEYQPEPPRQSLLRRPRQ